jgi:hypothetical protein
MDKGDPVLNVPTYNGGLFNTKPDKSNRRDQEVARFLVEHKVPDRYLALAIDRLSRDQDERTLALGFIDYKSLEVRHLGSIYEGLLEFKLKVAEEDLTTQADNDAEKYIKLSEAKVKRGRTAEIVVRKKEVYLSNDKFERKASGSYYTPDAIVEYIVANTVGPVLEEKLTAIRPEFRKVRKTFDNEVQKAKSYPPAEVRSGKMDERQWAAAKSYAAHKDLVEKLFDLKVLDPAMGSGHFLVEAVDFVTDRLLNFLNQFPINPVSYALDRTRTSILESLGLQGVTVNPDKLTDINLLKRHVLKRCIYGVDLNPMAVELAKVSLWLDAFTLGAPLSFLDHHLRCGNSLVGLTFEDLEEAINPSEGYRKQGGRAKGLFGLDYEPLLRAINYVLFVNTQTDATAGEVSASSQNYALARNALSGYRIILDLLLAENFGLPKAAQLVTFGSEYNLSDHDSFLASLHDDKQRNLVQQVEELANRPDRRFFHWEIEFPEIFFGFADEQHRQIQHKEKIASGSAGFDCVVGNPPYDVLAEKELGADLEYILDFFKGRKLFAPAIGGKQNLYKLFICRGFGVLHSGGRVGHIVPMPLLGDEQAVGLRKMLLSQHSLTAIEAFPQKDDPKNRVFEDAKLSTSIFIAAKKNEDSPFRARVHSGKSIELLSPSLSVQRSQVKLYDPENQPILACSQDDWDLAIRIMSSGRLKRLAEYATAYQGEVNETTDRNKGHISYESKDGPRILRGANVCLYTLRSSSQGEDIFMKTTKFLKGKKPSSKAWHHSQARIGFQRKSPQNNFRRLIATPVPAGEFCCESISYFPEKECKLPPLFLLALLNSKLMEWYFRIGSTNAMVNDYQIRILPAPFVTLGTNKGAWTASKDFRQCVNDKDFDGAFGVIEPLLEVPPFPDSTVAAVSFLVQGIIAAEQARGEIARSDRSALVPEAQPYQDLIDRILFTMAGLDDSEIAALEQRLESML